MSAGLNARGGTLAKRVAIRFSDLYPATLSSFDEALRELTGLVENYSEFQSENENEKR